MNNLLDGISLDVKQKIFECISQAVGEDRQEADAHLGLRTHVSGPFLNWDLIYCMKMAIWDILHLIHFLQWS